MDISYIRTSTQEQSPELQLRDIATLCPSQDALILSEQQSAYKENAKRPVFDKLMVLIKADKVKRLFVWDLDRIYRNRVRLKEFLILCKIHKVEIHSFNQKWLEEINRIPQPFNEIVMDLLINFTGWIGEEESTKKGNRVKMAVVRSAKGTFSYKDKKWGRKPLPKQTIMRVLELHEAGASVRSIARQIKVYDKNNNERQISKSAVHKIISAIAA